MTEHYQHGLDKNIPYPLQVRYLSEHEYELIERFEYRSEHGKTIGEYRGYIYDFGTVISITEWFVSRMEFGFAFTVHDIGCDRLAWDDGTPMTQKEVDDLFLEVVKHVHRSRWKRFKGRVAWMCIRAHSKTIKRISRQTG